MGLLRRKTKNKLDEVEILINQFFKSLFNDVVKAFYKKSGTKDGIQYDLFYASV